jgi:CubicO group peptidase (beta-lactamase class C family)
MVPLTPTRRGAGIVANIEGHCETRFEAVRTAFADNFETQGDVGASVAVVWNDELVVDLWGGHADADRTQAWERDTITNVWSSTKTMTALCALLLADRGEIDLHAPVAKYWPEFAANDKDAIEVRHLLSHTAGLAGWRDPVTIDDVLDWDRATSLLAAQKVWWEPGTASGYHALTQGHLVGEVVRRVSGKSLGTFFADELAGPLGADFHIGLDPSHFERVSNVIPPTEPLAASIEAGSLAAEMLANPPLSAEVAWTDAWRRAEVPAANGHGNARSVARVQSVLSHGGSVGGKHFLSPAGCDAVFEQQSSGTDLVLGVPLTLGIGYGLNSAETPIGINPRTCFWGGWGGSLVINDLDARMTIAYMMNKMGEGTLGDMRGVGIAFAAMTAVSGA